MSSLDSKQLFSRVQVEKLRSGRSEVEVGFEVLRLFLFNGWGGFHFCHDVVRIWSGALGSDHFEH